jgi:hypothetical protein
MGTKMKKLIIFTFAVLASCAPAFADEDPFADVHKSLKDQAFVVETDEESSAESLNRVSGQIDLGFTLPEQEYHSSSHNHINPLHSEDSQENTRQSY